jgi:glutamyl-tRNA reductase
MTTDPAASRDAPTGLAVVGLDHRAASPALRDAVFVPDDELDSFQGALRGAGLAQLLVLSTCDRLEIQIVAVGETAAAAAERAADVIMARAASRGFAGAARPVPIFGAAALSHVFRVASALESRVAGEPQILGQVKAADRRARAAGLMGAELDRILQAAYAAAKRVRSETTIGERPTSMAAASVAVARDVHGDLARAALLVIGTGELGEMIVDLFRDAGLRRALVTDPNPGRAAAQARRLGLTDAAFAGLGDLLVGADVVVSTAGLGRVLIDRPAMERVAQRRRRRATLLLDFAVPHDIDPAVDAVDGVFRYDVDDLERIALQGRAGRENELALAGRIVAEEVVRFRAAQAGRVVVPTILALRRRFEAARARALADAGDDAARATELMASRLLHLPQERLRALAGSDADPEARMATEAALRGLFGLDEDDALP